MIFPSNTVNVLHSCIHHLAFDRASCALVVIIYWNELPGINDCHKVSDLMVGHTIELGGAFFYYVGMFTEA